MNSTLELGFSPDILRTGFGALWCADFRLPVLVRVDESTLAAEIFGTFQATSEDYDAVEAFGNHGPRSVACGLGSVWVVPREGNRLLRFDPTSRRSESFELPFRVIEIAGNDEGVYGIGELGDGRIVRYDPEAGMSVRELARTLPLVVASDERVWTVDEAVDDILALDVRSLQPLRRFHHLGGADALVARGTVAWHCSTRQVEIDGRRAFAFGPSGPTIELFRLDADTGESVSIGEFPGAVPRVTLGPDRLWVSGPRSEGMEDDQPTSSLLYFDLDGEGRGHLDLSGQIDSLAASESILWVSGFQRTLQAVVLTAFMGDGTPLGEVSFEHLDFEPWMPPQLESPPHLPLDEFAEQAREIVEQSLREPGQSVDRLGNRWVSPPISEEFSLERVEVRGTKELPELAVLFRWAGHDDLFGISFPVTDEHQSAAPDGYISVHVQENLLAYGFGIENATRERADGVTWLRWSQWNVSDNA